MHEPAANAHPPNGQVGLIPLLAKEGWPRHQKMVPFQRGADGVVGSAELTTPSAALLWLRDF